MNLKACMPAAIILLISACANDKPAKKAGNETDKNAATSEDVSNDDMCVSLRAHSLSSNADFADFIKDLCDLGKLAILRADPYYYKGSGEPEVMMTDTANGGSSQMRLWSSLVSVSEAKAYFNMMRLQIDKPTEFDDPTSSGKNFEIDANITYTRKNGNAEATNYRYLNTKEDVAVEYEATSYFVEVVPNKLYAVTSKVDKGISIVKTFRGLQIINQVSGSSEVYSMSDQVYDNQGDHATMVAKAKRSFREDMARGYRNATHAADANKFYP